ncbi:fimbrial protein [Herbaspirillum sp. YR522]|uniref:fimbrial protein n=1 Tax=Herbaspirillum sp. YR522 TaxID=1144342 RepID=UPI00026F4AF4|nr:fimbrial protein [Herbaspirillum sp. YR522]EJN02061.1 P pilus assembly protein, pilin FimA [Herbaspirillum sp. YR522]
MKKSFVASALAIALLPGFAFAADGKININGAVNEGTCVYGNGANGQTVNMPTVSAASLTTAGSMSTVTPFEIALSSCALAQRVAVQLDGAANGDSTTGRLKNIATDGAAGNVQVGVVDRANNSAELRLPGSSVGVLPSAAGTATIPLGLRYVSTGAATGGVVTTAMDFSIIYP